MTQYELSVNKKTVLYNKHTAPVLLTFIFHKTFQYHIEWQLILVSKPEGEICFRMN